MTKIITGCNRLAIAVNVLWNETAFSLCSAIVVVIVIFFTLVVKVPRATKESRLLLLLLLLTVGRYPTIESLTSYLT